MDRRRRRKVQILIVLILALKLMQRRRRARRFWVRPSLKEKRTMAMVELANKDDVGMSYDEILQRGYFKAFTRMPFEQFTMLFEEVRPLIEKKRTRQPISALERLTITLRFLATGDNYDTLEKMFGVSKSSITILIPETCRAIILALELYIHTPNTAEEWQRISDRFLQSWNFPNCIGAIDGRHCPVIQPKYTGSDYYNYKNFFSLVLLAIVDGDYNFIYVDVGAQGSASDGGVFGNCSFKHKLDAGTLNIPEDCPLPGRTMKMPFVLVGDAAFALSSTLMKPYAGKHDEESPERHFNNRLSRARTRVENVFGICSARFRVLRKPMCLKLENAKLIILTTCYLHNFIRAHTSETSDTLHREVLEEARIRRDRPEEQEAQGFFPLRNAPRRASVIAKNIQKEFCDWCNSDAGFIPFEIRDH